MAKRVVITGMGVVTPVGIGLEQMWSALLEGKNGIGPITQFDASKHDVRIAGEVRGFDASDVMDKKEIRRTPKFIQYAMKTAKEAIDMAKLESSNIDKDRVAVIVGAGIGGIDVIEAQTQVLLEKGPGRVSPFLIPMLIPDMAGAFISMKYGFRGPNFCIVTACATGTHCLGEAAKIIQRGDADVAIAGGTEAALTSVGLAGFCSAKSLSTRNDDPEHASRPFDRDRDGFVMADGAGLMVLESLEHALKRGAPIIAEYGGYACSDDAYHMTAPSENGSGGALAIKNALKDAGLQTTDINYLNAHGTSTLLNDKEETAGIKAAFGEHAKKLAISSTKSMTGHMLGGTGAVEAICCALSCRDDVVHPTRNLENASPECDLDYVPKVKRKMTVNCAMSNSFGFGGHNASIIIKKYKP